MGNMNNIGGVTPVAVAVNVVKGKPIPGQAARAGTCYANHNGTDS